MKITTTADDACNKKCVPWSGPSSRLRVNAVRTHATAGWPVLGVEPCGRKKIEAEMEDIGWDKHHENSSTSQKTNCDQLALINRKNATKSCFRYESATTHLFTQILKFDYTSKQKIEHTREEMQDILVVDYRINIKIEIDIIATSTCSPLRNNLISANVVPSHDQKNTGLTRPRNA